MAIIFHFKANLKSLSRLTTRTDLMIFYWKPLEKHSFTHTTSSTEEQTASSITFVCLTKAAQKWMPTWFKMFQTIYAIIYLKSFTSMFFCALQEEPWQSVIKGNLWIKPWLTSVCLSHSVQQWISSRSLFFFFFFPWLCWNPFLIRKAWGPKSCSWTLIIQT